MLLALEGLPPATLEPCPPARRVDVLVPAGLSPALAFALPLSPLPKGCFEMASLPWWWPLLRSGRSGSEMACPAEARHINVMRTKTPLIKLVCLLCLEGANHSTVGTCEEHLRKTVLSAASDITHAHGVRPGQQKTLAQTKSRCQEALLKAAPSSRRGRPPSGLEDSSALCSAHSRRSSRSPLRQAPAHVQRPHRQTLRLASATPSLQPPTHRNMGVHPQEQHVQNVGQIPWEASSIFI